MTITQRVNKWLNRNKPKQLTYEEKQKILYEFDRGSLLKALKSTVEIPKDDKDYILFITEDKHLARFYKGQIKMGCNNKTPQEWIDQADIQAEKEKYTLRQKEKYVMFFEMCLKLQETEVAVEEFRKQKLEEKKK